MPSQAATVEQYLAELPADRLGPMTRLRELFNRRLPAGFQECMQHGMIGWVVPHTLYPAGYHANPGQPLPFLSLASKKQAISVYHMGVYADPVLLNWFIEGHAKASPKKLDMGRSCIRYRQPEHIPYGLLGELVAKVTPQRWIELYETNRLF